MCSAKNAFDHPNLLGCTVIYNIYSAFHLFILPLLYCSQKPFVNSILSVQKFEALSLISGFVPSSLNVTGQYLDLFVSIQVQKFQVSGYNEYYMPGQAVGSDLLGSTSYYAHNVRFSLGFVTLFIEFSELFAYV